MREGAEQAWIQFNNHFEMEDATTALSWQVNITRLNCLRTSHGLLIFPCFTWVTDSLLHNHCRHALCLQSAAPSVLRFHCHGNEQYMYAVLHSATLTPVLCYYGFPFHPVFQLGTHVGRVEPGSVNRFIPIYMPDHWTTLQRYRKLILSSNVNCVH